jgi:hypothetical protein
MRRRPRSITLAVAAILVFGQVGAALGYENNQSGPTPGGGAHRRINQLAGQLFVKSIVNGANGAAFQKYDFEPLFPAGKYVIEALNEDVPDALLDKVFKPAGITTWGRMEWREAEYQAAQVKANLMFSRWLVEGGFTADEPERFMSLRHFYNPRTDLGAAYLTDIPVITLRQMGTNPEIDAVTWATTHADNAYSWTGGKDALALAFTGGTIAETQLAYAKAWRSLGETMHLAADMTVPAHVRNDSHPGHWAASAVYDDLRSDAYEFLTNYAGQVDLGWVNQKADPNFISAIRGAATPATVMETIATEVNKRYFSTDTIPHEEVVVDDFGNEFRYETANNMGLGRGILYPSPRLEDATLDATTGNYTANDSAGQPVIMAHRSWLYANAWNMDPGEITLPAVQSQAQRLIPAAVWGGERLMELFMPLVELKVESVKFDDVKKAPVVKVAVGVRQALDGGGYAATPDPALMNGTEQSVLLLVRITRKDGSTEERTFLAPPTKVVGGAFEIPLDKVSESLGDIVSGTDDDIAKVEYGAGLDMGGILVRSDYFAGDEALKLKFTSVEECIIIGDEYTFSVEAKGIPSTVNNVAFTWSLGASEPLVKPFSAPFADPLKSEVKGTFSIEGPLTILVTLTDEGGSGKELARVSMPSEVFPKGGMMDVLCAHVVIPPGG